MKTEKVKATIIMDKKDYLHVSQWSDSKDYFKLTLCDKSKCPIHIVMDKVQLYRMLNSANTAMMHAQTEIFETINFDNDNDLVKAIEAVEVEV